jgi:acetate kinase
MNVLVCNAGSSSLKFSLFEAERERLLAEGGIDWASQPTRLIVRRPGQREVGSELPLRQHGEALARILEALQAGPSAPLRGPGDVHAVGHRVVHGGQHYSTAVRITADVRQAIGDLAELAPLHNPASLQAIEAVEIALPGVPQVAAFDTAFHATLPEVARTYPVPRTWTRDWGLRRYGFHGLSHAYCAGRAAELIGRDDARLVIAHLGNGASVSAVRAGICVDTSMGFTPMDGLMMGTRSGAVDPGLLIYVLRQKGLDADRLDHALNHESGLLGMSGISSDMRRVLAAMPQDPAARLAVDVYVHRIRQTIGAMAATLGGIDALVFTAGVGEHAVEIRERVCDHLGHLGLRLDLAANRACTPDAGIALPDSPGRILVIATREDLTIVRETVRVIGGRDAAH